MNERQQLPQDATALRQAFDLEFAKPATTERAQVTDLIAIQLAGTTYAVRALQVAGLHADLRITACPSPMPELLGIAGFRGTLTPVYDLAATFGIASEPCRWAMLVKGGELAFAYPAFVGHYRVEPSAIAVRRDANGQQEAEVVSLAVGVWPIIDLFSLVTMIRRRLPQTRT